jgi:hypothetical protein
MSEEPIETGDQETGVADLSNTVEMESPREEQQVPLDALKSERAERQRLQDELKMIQENMNLMLAQQQRQNKPQEEFSGLQDDDVLTVGEFKKAIGQYEKQYTMSLKELKIAQQHPDYQEVVTKYLPEVLKQNPSLKSSLAASQDFELAYYLAKNSEAYKQAKKQVKKNADAERIVQNSQRAGTISSVGQTSPISEAKRYRDMSDSDFRQLMNKNLGYF